MFFISYIPYVQVEKYNQKVTQQDYEIARLTAELKGLQEEASDSAKNLEDVIKTNDALLLNVGKLERTLKEKDGQISALLKEHNLLVQKSKANGETIASLTRDRMHCQC